MSGYKNKTIKDNAKNFASEMQHGHCQLGFALGILRLRRAGKAREERGTVPPTTDAAACQAQ